ncbi:MAG: GTP-binding protein [Synergistaceae bacterium]|nr:GTP-binding protein [Synergistaceae bacterium]
MIRMTLISGFLGAGKTTFANLLMDYYIRTGEKTAYVVNEFGEAGVDSALLAQKGFQTVDIVGGCICCTLQGKIGTALREIVDEFAPTRIVFEPSGIFIFEKFQDVLRGDPVLDGNCQIDSVITVVDSNHVTDAMLVPGNFFSNQVAHADVLVLSKLESYDGDVGRLARRLAPLNERADILAKPWGELSDKDFATLDIGGSVGVSADDEDDDDGRHDHNHHHHHHHGHGHHHDDGHGHSHIHPDVDTVTVEPRSFDEKSISGLEGMLRDGAFGDVYRIKGKVIYRGEPKMLQGVFDTLRIESPPPDGPCRLVFIGKDIKEKNIAKFWGELKNAG